MNPYARMTTINVTIGSIIQLLVKLVRLDRQALARGPHGIRYVIKIINRTELAPIPTPWSFVLAIKIYWKSK